jgi:hypothetical protein
MCWQWHAVSLIPQEQAVCATVVRDLFEWSHSKVDPLDVIAAGICVFLNKLLK